VAKGAQEYAELLVQLSAEPGQQLSLTDPESRLLHKGNECVVGDHAQIAVDGANHLIAAQEGTRDPHDTPPLAPMAEGACAALEVDTLAVTSDGGFYNLAPLERCRGPRTRRRRAASPGSITIRAPAATARCGPPARAASSGESPCMSTRKRRRPPANA
jgi:hypothetical protein